MIREFSFGSLKVAIIQLNLSIEVLGLQRKGGEKPILNPENDLILAPTDHIVYMARKRFDWMKNNGQILQKINKAVLTHHCYERNLLFGQNLLIQWRLCDPKTVSK